MGASRRSRNRTAAATAEALVKGIFEGQDWGALHRIVADGLERGVFKAPAVTRFLSYAVRDAAMQKDLRSAIVSDRSWKRRVSEAAPLSAWEVERMLDVGEVVRESRRLYGGDEDAAERFLTTPHPRLDGQPPVLVAAAEGGAQAVRELLGRMEEGAPA